jgi:WD40 repeat protein
VLDTSRQATSYVALRQALSQYQQKALPLIQEKIRTLPVTLRGHEYGVPSVTFSPDGKFLASGSLDETVKIWKVGNWREVATLREHEDSVQSVTFSPDGKFLASGSLDKTVKVWGRGLQGSLLLKWLEELERSVQEEEGRRWEEWEEE